MIWERGVGFGMFRRFYLLSSNGIHVISIRGVNAVGEMGLSLMHLLLQNNC